MEEGALLGAKGENLVIYEVGQTYKTGLFDHSSHRRVILMLNNFFKSHLPASSMGLWALLGDLL